PAAYRLVWRGRFYDVWQRVRALEAATKTRQDCGVTRTLSSSNLSQSASPRSVVLGLGQADHPPTWPVATGGQAPHPSGPGVIRARIRLTRTGPYSVWVGGSFRKRIAAVIDGREIGARTDQLNNAGQFTSLGSVTLISGAHDVELRYSSSRFAPGSGGPEYGLGPLVVSPDESVC